MVLGLPWLSERTHERLREARFSAKGQIWNGCSSSSILLVCLPRSSCACLSSAQRRQIPKIDQRFSRTERGLLAVLSLGGFFIPLIYSLTSWLDFANYRWSPATKARVGSIGTVLLGAAIWLFWRSHRDLGKNWSPSLEISAQQTLITHGVYRTIRHPMFNAHQEWIEGLAEQFS